MTMIGTPPDDSSVVNVFDLVLGENGSDGEYNGIEDERYHKIHARNTNRRISRKYVRPVFKEPGSKLRKTTEIPFEQRQYATIPVKVKRTSGNLTIASPVSSRGLNNSPTIYKDDENLFQSSLYHTSRLEYIVGNPIERHEFKKRNKTVTLRSGIEQRYNHERLSHLHHAYNNPKTEGPIATMSDINVLEAKILRPKICSTRTEGGQLNVLRREINKIVSCNLDEADGGRGFPRIFETVNYEESREDYEACASHGCAGFLQSGNELHDLINNMKEYFTR